jgi:transposase InsO family protein
MGGVRYGFYYRPTKIRPRSRFHLGHCQPSHQGGPLIPVKTVFNGRRLDELYISGIVSLHGVPKVIVSDQGSQFTSRFWDSLHEALGTKLSFGTTYHPQTGGQTERVNQILEDMLCVCVLSYATKWEDYLPFAEFSYNNSR